MAGLGEMFGWKGNPIYDGFSSHRNAIGQAFAGLTGAKTFGEGARGVAAGALSGGQIDLEEMARQKQMADQQAQLAKAAQGLASMGRDDLAQAVNSGFDVSSAWNLALTKGAAPDMTSDIQNYEYGLSHPGFAEAQTNKGGAAEMSLSGTYGTDNDPKSPTFGQTILGQLGKDGIFHRTEMGGVTPMSPYDLNAQKAAGTALGKGVGGAQFNMPQAQMTVSQTKEAINRLRNDTEGMAENFGSTLFVPNQMTPTWPQSKKADFLNNLLEAQGKAFLQARDMLKGGGQITDYEGQKAEQAITRMEAAAKSGSEQAFKTALDDFEAAVDAGYQKMQAQSSMLPQAGQTPGGAIDPSNMSDEELLNALGG